MSLERGVANLFIKGCGLWRLHGGSLQRLTRAVLDEIDLQALRNGQSCPCFFDRSEMYRYVHTLRLNGNAVDYLEFGVFEGDSMRHWLHLNSHQASRFYGFDSFEGLPEDWRPGQEKGHFNTRGTAPRIDDPRVEFVKGWFEATIPSFVRGFVVKNQLIIHIDADLYGSAMLALVHFAPLMRPGTLLIFDEFYDREHEFKALKDWQRIFRKRFQVIAETANYAKVCLELL